ncbi:MAG: polyketide cyclase [Hydrocarboniphaga sp.]|uniref:SRPBCC family protein n=1 Tax=Hydrocarboniphaga sp. TaxID=2033016 RepID=UPI0026024EE8|nr:SRPBCC family protein [Hydrocarboniphaga sp.]MDB5970508.1 polyketide cyclase [Hydrocarboniphaga sp.]
MFKTIAIILVLAVVAILIYATTRPDTLHVQRSITIKAPPETIFPQIDTLGNWRQWSPYEKYDPAMKRTFEGPAGGQGAAYAWDGSSKVGAGRMEIIESAPSSKVVFKLDFMRPFEAHNTATFTLLPNADGTTVTWAMDGPAPYINKLMGIFFNMDEMIGKDFAAGLASLKTLTEAAGA